MPKVYSDVLLKLDPVLLQRLDDYSNTQREARLVTIRRILDEYLSREDKLG